MSLMEREADAEVLCVCVLVVLLCQKFVVLRSTLNPPEKQQTNEWKI